MPPLLALYAKQFLETKLFTFDYHENKSQRTVDYSMYRSFIRPKVHCSPEFSFNMNQCEFIQGSQGSILFVHLYIQFITTVK